MKKQDLIIIGGGAAGLVVASVAAQLGLKTLLIEKRSQLGGDCLHTGCVPSKSLLKFSQVAHVLNNADVYGLDSSRPDISIETVNRYVKNAVDIIQQHDSHERFEELGCLVVQGDARFLDTTHVAIEDKTFSANRFVIATGSVPYIPNIPGLDKAGYLTNEDIFSLKKLPSHLVIIGAGAMGMEMAQAFVRLGVRVTVIDQRDRALMSVDAEAALLLTELLENERVNFVFGKVVEKIETNGVDKTIKFSDDDCITADQLLLACGRSPAVDSLALDNAGVDFSEKGIAVDDRMRTSQKHIYACGDVTGKYQLTHVAEQEAGVVIANAVFRWPKKMKYNLVPVVLYTDPECAQVGVDPGSVKDIKKYKLVKFEYSDLDRAITEKKTAGFIKLVLHRGKLVGATVIGERAGEIIHQLSMAIENNISLSKVAAMVYAYPAYSQIIRRASSQYYASRLYGAVTRWLVSLINRWLP